MTNTSTRTTDGILRKDLDRFRELILRFAEDKADEAKKSRKNDKDMRPFFEGELSAADAIANYARSCGLLDAAAADTISNLLWVDRASNNAQALADYKTKTDPIYQRHGIV
jgi:hypothetical protein